MSKITPGPWTDKFIVPDIPLPPLDDRGPFTGDIVTYAPQDDGWVDYIEPWTIAENVDNPADRRLICAALDLLEACKCVRDSLTNLPRDQWYDHQFGDMVKLSAAIQKAEGI